MFTSELQPVPSLLVISQRPTVECESTPWWATRLTLPRVCNPWQRRVGRLLEHPLADQWLF